MSPPIVTAAITATFGTSFFCSCRRRHTILVSDWSSDVCSSDLAPPDEGDSASVGSTRQRPASVNSVHPTDAESPSSGGAPLQRRALRDWRSAHTVGAGSAPRSEERRVGKEWRWGWLTGHVDEYR